MPDAGAPITVSAVVRDAVERIPGARATLEASIRRRVDGEPVAYIRGFREFHGLALATDARALIPRPETELLVDAALAEVTARLTAASRAAGAPALRIADVGTGSGAIALAILASLRARRMVDQVLVIATDASPEALDLARENAVGHGLADRLVFVEADLLPPVVEPAYAVVCANLPYVPAGAISGLERELAYEPRSALDGGADGLDVIRRLLDRLPDALAPGGVAFLEIGADQESAFAAAVAERLPGWGCAVTADLAGLPRLARVDRGTGA
jgi:release factor glutamine methyltransferase